MWGRDGGKGSSEERGDSSQAPSSNSYVFSHRLIIVVTIVILFSQG